MMNFWIIWLFGCAVVALAMEIIKLKKMSSKQYTIIGIALTLIMTTSVWMGLPNHIGNFFILPALYVAGYFIQLFIDMLGFKKIFFIAINAWLKKHGYEKIELET